MYVDTAEISEALKMQAEMGYQLHSHHGHTQNNCKAAWEIAETDKGWLKLQQTRQSI